MHFFTNKVGCTFDTFFAAVVDSYEGEINAVIHVLKRCISSSDDYFK